MRLAHYNSSYPQPERSIGVLGDLLHPLPSPLFLWACLWRRHNNTSHISCDILAFLTFFLPPHPLYVLAHSQMASNWFPWKKESLISLQCRLLFRQSKTEEGLFTLKLFWQWSISAKIPHAIANSQGGVASQIPLLHGRKSQPSLHPSIHLSNLEAK